MSLTFEVSEEVRLMMNERVRELQIEKGIHEHSDLSFAQACLTIEALHNMPRQRRRKHPVVERLEDLERWHQAVEEPTPSRSKGEKMITAMADWHPICLLNTYLDRQSTEYQRDSFQFGVYIMFEFTPNGYVPAFVEANPKYVGMSVQLSQRLGSQHLAGRGSTPAKVVTEQWLAANGTETDAVTYSNASPEAQREFRAACIQKRGLWVQTVHTDSKVKAEDLEKAVTRLYEAHGIVLWNNIKFKTTPPFRITHKTT